MFAESAGDFGANALSLAIFVLLMLLGAWNIWLNSRLRQARSLEDELHALVGRRLGDRLDADDPAFSRALEQALRDRLPEVIRRELESPDSSLHAALAQRLTRQLDSRDDEPLAAQLREHLLDRVAAIFAAPGDHEGLFEAIDGKLGARVLARVDPALDDPRLAALTGERLFARLEQMFDRPEDHEEVFEAVDEKLGECILRQAGKLPDEAAARLEAAIRDALVAEVQYIFENPQDYEGIVETIDEQLGQRITRLAGHPSPELQEALDGPIRDGLAGRLHDIFARPDDHEGLLEEVDEQLGKRVERRLREELARGGDGLIEQLLVEALRERVHGRLDARRESLDLSIDTRIARHNGEGGA